MFTYLMSWRAFSNDNIARAADHGNPIGVQQLAVPLAALAELELETSLLVKDLDAMVVSVSYDDVILCIDSYTTGFGKLAF